MCDPARRWDVLSVVEDDVVVDLDDEEVEQALSASLEVLTSLSDDVEADDVEVDDVEADDVESVELVVDAAEDVEEDVIEDVVEDFNELIEEIVVKVLETAEASTVDKDDIVSQLELEVVSETGPEDSVEVIGSVTVVLENDLWAGIMGICIFPP